MAASRKRRESRERRPPRPLGAARLEELALAYVARFATSAARLDDYLRRKLRERGWEGEGEPPVARLVERFVASGYVDDAAFARAKAGGLLRRGYGGRRIGQALNAAGIAEDLRADVAPGEHEARSAALALARRRRFGPFGAAPLERPQREKQVAAMLRAGHPMDFARVVIDAASEQAAIEWVAAAREDDE
ncbi:RecX family transcriptional regulator [Parablastomonas sp. CN1-191]|uniref:RecX family transcriptional regulator n=1 Tax=Parablastomonas sp. CN1-191 TaxID=3400908 RepID=UPI003BF80D3B